MSLGTELIECKVCGAVGLPERILEHDCQAFLDRQSGDGLCPESSKPEICSGERQ